MEQNKIKKTAKILKIFEYVFCCYLRIRFYSPIRSEKLGTTQCFMIVILIPQSFFFITCLFELPNDYMRLSVDTMYYTNLCHRIPLRLHHRHSRCQFHHHTPSLFDVDNPKIHLKF